MNDRSTSRPPEHSQSRNDSSSATATRVGRRRNRMRFGLLELLLITTVVAAWLPMILVRRQISELESEIETMRFATTQLIVVDEAKLNVRSLPSIWSSINSWKYNAPADADLELRLATETINSVSAPSQYLAAALPEGEHSIHLKCTSDSDGYHSLVYLDDELILEEHHPKSWIESQGSSSTGEASNRSTAYPLNKPLKLKVQRLSAKHPLKKYNSIELSNEYDSKGNYLWISPASMVPDPTPVFLVSNDKYSHDGLGLRQGIKVFRSQQTGLIGLIGVLPSLDSTLGDNRHWYPHCPFGVSVRPVLQSLSRLNIPEEGGPRSAGIPISLRDTLDPPTKNDGIGALEKITQASIDESGSQMRIFAHYQPFESGAQPIVEIRFDAAHPNRIGFLPHTAPNSAPMKACQFVTRFNARFLWREIEIANDESDSALSGDSLKEPNNATNDRVRQPLASLYPNVDFTAPLNPTTGNIAPFEWRKILTSRLPTTTRVDGDAKMTQLTLKTDVLNATTLNYPAGLDPKWKYEGIPNRQTWLLPRASADDEPEITAEIRGGAVFPIVQLPIPGGPVIQNVRITVPMPAKKPVWLEIAPEPLSDSK
ncbi:hypothetical protein SAMN06265222_101594 [Neorhodopirellula lusitana]|uniref:Uncharacterized protein n=1 Tax=Neorhodopirellula lusitana TaxID=445327 RepID=A0ABY1PSG5_9BACT|nr:hypothetical protein [Neorhodopirellula lusitana]SMP41485.1 hypothetical protein SAMN06265222_101594 [Neorhodopirellula lusitana]